MADQQKRGGQKQGNQNQQTPEQAQGVRANEQQDQRTNPDDARRKPTDQRK
jgi:hypothetical protein